jgi:hypothetical protein
LCSSKSYIWGMSPVGGPGQSANMQLGGMRPTKLPSGHSRTSVVHATLLVVGRPMKSGASLVGVRLLGSVGGRLTSSSSVGLFGVVVGSVGYSINKSATTLVLRSTPTPSVSRECLIPVYCSVSDTSMSLGSTDDRRVAVVRYPRDQMAVPYTYSIL